MREVHGWRRVGRWAIGIVSGLIGLVGLVLLVAAIVFETGWGRGILQHQIEARMNKTFVGGAAVGWVEGNPLSELVLHDVVINGPDKQPAIKARRLIVKLPLLPLISHQLRVEKVIAEDLDITAKKLANGDFNLAHMQNPSEPSTWSIMLPDVEVHRGHVLVDRGNGTKPIDVDNVELAVDARLPFAGPMDANVMITGRWRQKQAPISIGAVIHADKGGIQIRNAGVQLGDLRAVALGLDLPRGDFEKAYGGTLAVVASAKTVKELAPSVELPDDIAVAIAVHPRGRLTGFTINGAIGKRGKLYAFGSADVVAKQVSGVFIGDDLDLAKLTNGKLDGHGGAFAAVKLDGTTHDELPTASGVITTWSSAMQNVPPLQTAIAIDSLGDRIRATVGATSGNGIRAGIGAAVRKHGNVMMLERGDLIASTRDLRRASMGKAPVRGVLNANLHAEGRLAPNPDLTVRGHANGRRLSGVGASARTLALRIDAAHLPSHPVGSGRVELRDVERGDLQFGKLVVAAGNRPDGKLQVSIRSHPKPAPWQVDVDALVTQGETIVVDLQRHFVRAAGGSTWSGTTGRLTIAPKQIALTGVHSTSKHGNLAADATYVRAGRHKGDFTAKLDADVELGNLAKGHKGHVTAHVDMQRVAMRLSGVIDAHGTGVSLRPDDPVPVDGDVKIEARDQQVLANIVVKTEQAGSAKLALDVNAPKDITNVKAWSKLDRDAVRTAQLTLQAIDLAGIARLANTPPMSGSINGTLELSPANAGGSIAIRGVKVQQTQDVGAINADLELGQAGTGDLKATLVAKLVPAPGSVAAQDVTKNGQARLLADATLRTPEKIFDPAAWKRLGHNAFRGATLRAERLAFQPGTLERLGIVTALRGELGIGAEVGEGMHEVRFSVNLHDLRGGLLAKPVAINVVGAIDQQSTRAQADVRAQGVTLVHVTSQIPITIDQLRADPKSAKQSALTGEARINNVPATTLMNVLGTSQITGGVLDGTVVVGGTVGKPTIDAKLVAHDVTVPNEGTRKVQQIRQLQILATWDGAAGNVAIDGDETAGGKLKIRAAGSPAELDNVSASIYATKLDIAPLVAFMPGPAGGVAGQLDADFALKGANPKTAQLDGKLQISRGRIPIAPAVGTLFQGDVKINVQHQVFGLRMTGKLGRGDVSLTADAPLEGVTPKNGKLQLRVHKVQLIGTTEPILTGVVDADIARIGDTWRSNVRITKMDVKVPKEKGVKLKPVGTPTDLVYGGEKIHHGEHHGKDVPQGIVKDKTGPADFKPPTQVAGEPAQPAAGEPVHRKAPDEPVLVAYIRMRNVEVESEEVRGLLGGKLTISVAQNKEVGIIGNISLSRGVLDLFSRRYNVDRAALHFDGSPDPVLDVRITHDFPEVTTITEVRGRMSKPQLMLSSEPGRYSQAELLGFLLGGEPAGDPENAPSAAQRVEGAGASFVANRIGGYVKKALPVDVDVLRYEAATSTNSAAITVGTWITDTLFLAYRQHLEAHPDENTGEGEVEYWIQRRLVLQGVAGNRGVTGADLLWRRRW